MFKEGKNVCRCHWQLFSLYFPYKTILIWSYFHRASICIHLSLQQLDKRQEGNLPEERVIHHWSRCPHWRRRNGPLKYHQLRFVPPVTPGMHRPSHFDDARRRNDVPLRVFVDRHFYFIIISPCEAPVTFLLWNPTQNFGREGEEDANSRPPGARRTVRSDEEMGKERQGGKEGGMKERGRRQGA